MVKVFKSMKKLKLKIASIVLLVALLTVQYGSYGVFAATQNVTYRPATIVNVGYDTVNGKNVWFSNVKLGDQTAYCIDYSCPAPNGTMTLRDYLSDQGMAILMNGYPNCTPAEIGVQTEDEAYMATQLALWEVMNRTGESHKAGRIFRVENIRANSGKEAFLNSAIEGAKRLVTLAENNPYNGVPTMNVHNGNAKTVVTDDGYVKVGPYSITVTGTSAATVKSITASLKNAPSSATIVDAAGNKKSTINSGEEVYVKFSVKEDSQNFQISFKTEVDRKVGAIYEQFGKIVQDYVRLDTVPVSMEKDCDIEFEKITDKGRIELIKVDQDDQPVSGAKFKLIDQYGNELMQVETHEDGVIDFYNVPVGNYILEEIEAPAGYTIKNKTSNVTVVGGQLSTVKVVNERESGKLVITKIDDLDEVIPGAVFTIYDSEGYEYDTITTDANGKASIDLPLGTWYYQEESVPEGYIKDDTLYRFDLTTENKAHVTTVVNEVKKGELAILKKDDSGKPIKGVKFAILDQNKNQILTIETNDNGMAGVNGLKVGRNYYYKEIEVPDYVVMDPNEYVFKIETPGQIIRKEIVNETIKGSLKIFKINDEDGVIEGVVFNILDKDKNVVDTLTTNEQGIAVSKTLTPGKYYYKEVSVPDGVTLDETEYEFSITKENIIQTATIINKLDRGQLQITKYDDKGNTLAGVEFDILDEDKNVVDHIVTDAEGKALSKKLKLGTYYYVETKAPSHVVSDGKEHEFVLNANNQVVQKTVINTTIEGKLRIIKVDENSKPLAGVTFNIYDADKNVVDTIVTNDKGIAESKQLEKGKYYYQEITAPKGVRVDSTMYEFELKEDKENVIRNMVNYYDKGTLTLIKVDENEKALAGVTFKIYNEDYKVVDEIVTDENGVAKSNVELVLGKYYYQETSVPEGLRLDSTMYEFELTTNGQNVIKNMINYFEKGTLTIIKVDEDENPLKGVTFEIYDEDKNLVDTIVTDEKGVAESNVELVLGKYYYKETKAPEGVIIDDTMYEFELKTDRQNVIKTMTNKYIKGELVIYKLVEGTDTPLAGAKFEITNEAGEVVDTIVTDENGVAKSKALVYGTYYFKEVEVPEGYVLDENTYMFKIENEEAVEAVVYNKEQEIPETGDNMMITLLVAIISLAGYSVVKVLETKNEN